MEEGTSRLIIIGIGVILICSVFQALPFQTILKVASADDPVTVDWWMFRHDMNRTGNSSSRAPNTCNILWTDQILPTGYTWGYCGSPAVAGGLVFLGGQRPDGFRAFDAITGQQKWEYVPGERVTCSPTVTNDHVLFASYDNNLYSRAYDTGAQVWTKNMNVDIDSSPTVYNGKVYIGSGRGDYVPTQPSKLFCLDETNGNIVWTFQAGGQIISSPTIVNDQVIFGSYDGNVYALPAEDPDSSGVITQQEIIWTFNVGARVVASAAVQDDVVYIGSWNGKLYAIPLIDPNHDDIIDSNEVIWEFATGNEIWGSAGISNGRVFIGSHDNHLYTLPKDDPNGDGVISAGEILWEFQTTDKIWSSPSIAGGKVFIASEDFTLWALCEETGELIWNYIMPLQGEPFGSELLYATPAIVDGKVYIGNWDLTLYCFGNDSDLTPPIVTNVMPGNNSLNVPLNSDIEIIFNETLCDALITDSSISVQSSSGKCSHGQLMYNDTTSTLVFNPDEDFIANERYTVRLHSRYLQDYAGNPLDGNCNGAMDLPPQDDYLWYFNTSALIGHKPKVEDASVTPQQGNLTTKFDFFVTYTDEDGDTPLAPSGYIKVFIDDSFVGEEMDWANDTNTPYFHLLDKDPTNGELFRMRTQFCSVGEHKFYIECSDGSNTNRTPEYPLPTVLNAAPDLAIPTQYVSEDEEYLLNLSQYVNDIDNATTMLSFGEDSENCEIVGNYFLSCLFTDEELLSETVNITASDGIHMVCQDVLFIVNPVNDPPMWKPGILGLPPVSVYEDSVYEFDLSEYITDPDTPKELLMISFDAANITSSGLILYLLYPEPHTYENVSLSISDGSGDLESFLEVNVLPINHPPVLDVPSLVLTEDVTSSFDLGQYITDEDSQISELELKIISEALGEIEISGTELILCYPEGIIEDYLNITVVDGNIEVNQKVRAIIIPVNDAPGLRSPRVERVLEENKSAYNFLVGYFDEDLISNQDIEPHVNLVLNDKMYPLIMLKEKEPTERLYGITLELEKGTYLYHFECNDRAGEVNSHNSTSVMTLKISNGVVEDGNGEPKPGWDTDRPWLLGILFLIIAIAFLVLINIWLHLNRGRHGRLPEIQPQETPSPTIEEKEVPPVPSSMKAGEDGLTPPDEEITKDESPPFDDGKEPSPPLDEEIPEDRLPPTDDEDEPRPPIDEEIPPTEEGKSLPKKRGVQ